ncbi:MAG: peptidoglycan editing factor PgeF [Steroidobacteraceae bacterium]|nr:peptidoglycan editing factor PgeF [Steroidobacteraceae bacterium]
MQPQPARTIPVIEPDWPRALRVRAAMTLREGGVSKPPFDTLNLGTHVGDDAAAVSENRRRVRESLGLPREPAWLEQVHGTQVADLDATDVSKPIRADAAVTRDVGRVCVIQVADCLPVLLAARDSSVVGAAHAGWRGLAGGVIEATVRAMNVPASQLLAWLGPAIGPEHFEVGDEVRAAFVRPDPRAASAFTRNERQRWQCDLYALAQMRLSALGVQYVSGGGWSTYADASRFFSYRRDGQCGRMAALIWIES